MPPYVGCYGSGVQCAKFCLGQFSPRSFVAGRERSPGVASGCTRNRLDNGFPLRENGRVNGPAIDSPALRPRLPSAFFLACRHAGVALTRFVLTASIARQRVAVFNLVPRPLAGAFAPSNGTRAPEYSFRREFLASTSRFGIGQLNGSNRTPLGLHRVARKVGGGQPIGTVFKARRPIGLTWRGLNDGGIVHRILWLEGLEPGLNRGGEVDSFRRCIYIHGFGDETTLGRPMSLGCVHLAAADLMPLFELVPEGTLVWISER